MTFFPDLSRYCYMPDVMSKDTFNIGWLCSDSDYPTGDVSGRFVDCLWSFCRHPVQRTRGFYHCDFCLRNPPGPLEVTHGSETPSLGTAEIRVFGADRKIYAAPDLVFHYVTQHRYCPPEEFLLAVVKSPKPETREYKDMLFGFEDADAGDATTQSPTQGSDPRSTPNIGQVDTDMGR